jgi:aspartyl protease family protein
MRRWIDFWTAAWERVVLISHVKIAIGLSLVALFVAQKLGQGKDLASARVSHAARIGDNAPRPQTVQSAVSPRAGLNEYRIAADGQGQYFADVEIEGKRLHMLVDTGASSVALSYEDAAAAGVLPLPADYKFAVNTANGVARVARVRLRNVRVGPLTVHDVEAFVGERGALASSLLGMTFLSKLSHIEVAAGALVLRQ